MNSKTLVVLIMVVLLYSIVMFVSMIQLIVEMPETQSLKDKRQQVSSIKSRVIRKFHISFAEIDLLDSISFAHLGGAVVSNSKKHGESIMQKVLDFVEKTMAARIHDYQIHTESF